MINIELQKKYSGFHFEKFKIYRFSLKKGFESLINKMGCRLHHKKYDSLVGLTISKKITLNSLS